MRTFKVKGGGPLAGQVFYGKIVESSVHALDNEIGLRLDDHYVVNDARHSGLIVCAVTGACTLGGLHSDFLRVDPDDLPALRDAWREARGEGKVS